MLLKLIIKNRVFVRKYFSFILIGKYTDEPFGIQITIGHFVFQYAFGKFGVFNTKTCKWSIDIVL